LNVLYVTVIWIFTAVPYGLVELKPLHVGGDSSNVTT
jgi:hypothetical protein